MGSAEDYLRQQEPLRKAEQETFPLLDQYKKAWTTLYDPAKVAEVKEELKKKVQEMHPEFPTVVEYFEDQCWQIEQRWARPEESGRTVN